MNLINRFLIATLLCSIFILPGCAESETAESYFLKAEQAFANKQLRTAEIQLKNALQQAPDHTPARLLLARIYLLSGQGNNAVTTLHTALNGPDAAQARPIAVEALLLEGAQDKALALLPADPQSAQDLALRGDILRSMAKPEQARQDYEQALVQNPKQLHALVGLAYLAANQQQWADATTYTTTALTQYPDSYLAWLARAELLHRQHDLPAAEQALETALDKITFPQDYRYYLIQRQLVALLLNDRQLEKVRQQLTKLSSSPLKQRAANDYLISFARAVIAYDDNQLEEAKRQIETSLNLKRQPAALLLGGAINTRLQHFEQAESLLGEFLSINPWHTRARNILAFVQLQKRTPDKALATLQPLADKNNNELSTLALLASAALSEGDSAQSTHFYQQALAMKPLDPAMTFGLVASQLQQQNYTQAIDELQKLRDNQIEVARVNLTLLKTYIQAGQLEKALRHVQQMPQEERATPLVATLEGTVYLLQNKPDQARQTLQQALQLQPGYPPAVQQLVLLATREGDEQQVNTLYQQAIDAGNPDPVLVSRYANHLVKDGKLEQAQHLIEQSLQAHPDDLLINLTHAALLNQRNEPLQAIAILNRFQNRNSAGVAAELGKARLLQGDYVLARDAFLQAIALNPASPLPYFFSHWPYLALKQPEQAKQQLLKALEHQEDFLPALLALADIALAQQQVSQAKQYLDKAQARYPEQPPVLELAARLANAEQDWPVLLERLQQLFTLRQSAATAGQIALVQQRLGQADQAIEAARTATTLEPSNPAGHVLLGTIQMERGDLAGAEQAYRTALELQPENPVILNNLAWVLRNKDPQAALNYAQKAQALAPESREIEDTLLQIQRILHTAPPAK